VVAEKMHMGNFWTDTNTGNTKYSKKILSQCHFINKIARGYSWDWTQTFAVRDQCTEL